MNAHAEIARLRDERDDLLAMVDYQKQVIAEMAGHALVRLPGLTVLQSRIIRCLEAANGRVVSKHGLMCAMYPDSAGDWPEIKIVDVYISKIRATSNSYRARLQNEWGEGFRLVPA